jgi:hypothetical protein
MLLAASQVDLVYSSRSLESKLESEEKALREFLRVDRKDIVLVEHVYEPASSRAQSRMQRPRYVEDRCKLDKRKRHQDAFSSKCCQMSLRLSEDNKQW